MTGTITLTVDLPNERIGVTLGSWAAADGPVVVNRVHPDTTEWPVRGGGFNGAMVTSGGATFAWDYEAPFGVPVTYYAFDGSTKVTSASATLTVTYPLLRGPGLPANDATFDLLAKPTVKYVRPPAILYPLGRNTPVAITTARETGGGFDLTVETHSDGQARALLNTVTQSAVCLLLIPNSRQGWQYVSVGDVTEAPFSPFLSSADGDPGSWATFTLPCTVVDRPVGGIYGDPTASYAAVLASYTSYTALKTFKATYLDVLRGVP